MSDAKYPVVSADLQVRLWARLQMLRRQYLGEGLAAVIEEIPLERLDAELHEIVGGDRLFFMDRILDPATEEHARFRDQLHQALGI